MDSNKNIDLLINWLKSNYTIELFSNDDGYIVLVYTQCNKNFGEIIPQEYWDIEMQFHYPNIIVLPQGTKYLVGIDTYNKDIEFITIKIKK